MSLKDSDSKGRKGIIEIMNGAQYQDQLISFLLALRIPRCKRTGFHLYERLEKEARCIFCGKAK